MQDIHVRILDLLIKTMIDSWHVSGDMRGMKKNLQKDLIDFSLVFSTAFECDIWLEIAEELLDKKYSHVEVPFSQQFRQLDILSLPVLDGLIDPKHEVDSFSQYTGEFKNRWKQIHCSREISDEDSVLQKTRLKRNKKWWIEQKDKADIFPYSSLILKQIKNEDKLFYPLEIKQILLYMLNDLPKDLPILLHQLRSKSSKTEELSKDLKTMDTLIQKLLDSLDAFEKKQVLLFNNIDFLKYLQTERLVGNLIFMKQIEKIVPLSLLKGCNDLEYYRSLALFKGDREGAICRKIQEESELFLTKLFLGCLLYTSVGDSELYQKCEILKPQLKNIKEEVKEEYMKEAKFASVLQFFAQPKIQKYLETLDFMNFSSLRHLYDPMKIYSIIRILRRDPISRGSTLDKINEKYQFLKGR